MTKSTKTQRDYRKEVADSIVPPNPKKKKSPEKLHNSNKDSKNIKKRQKEGRQR